MSGIGFPRCAFAFVVVNCSALFWLWAGDAFRSRNASFVKLLALRRIISASNASTWNGHGHRPNLTRDHSVQLTAFAIKAVQRATVFVVRDSFSNIAYWLSFVSIFEAISDKVVAEPRSFTPVQYRTQVTLGRDSEAARDCGKGGSALGPQRRSGDRNRCEGAHSVLMCSMTGWLRLLPSFFFTPATPSRLLRCDKMFRWHWVFMSMWSFPHYWRVPKSCISPKAKSLVLRSHDCMALAWLYVFWTWADLLAGSKVKVRKPDTKCAIWS